MRRIATDNETVSVMRCGVGDETYCVEMAAVAAIHRLDHSPAPMENGLVGYIDDRGQRVPVFSLAHRLRRDTASGRRYAIVVSGSEKPWAMAIDEVTQVMAIRSDSITSLPPFLAGQCPFKGTVVVPREGLDVALDATSPQGNGRDETKSESDSDVSMMLLLATEQMGPNVSLPARGLDSTPWEEDAVPTPPAPANSRRRGQMVLFPLDPDANTKPNLVLGLSVHQLMEVLEPTPKLAVPLAPDFCHGMICWRHQPVPVVDLHQLLKIHCPVERPRLVVVRSAATGDYMAFPVYADMKMLRLPVPHAPCGRALSLARQWVRAIFELESQTLVIPDLRRIYQLCA